MGDALCDSILAHGDSRSCVVSMITDTQRTQWRQWLRVGWTSPHWSDAVSALLDENAELREGKEQLLATGYAMIAGCKWSVRIEHGYVRVDQEGTTQINLMLADMEKLRILIAEAMAEL